MKVDLIFVGNSFFVDANLREYVVRKISKKVDFIHSITYFKDNDNGLFLHLQNQLDFAAKTIIVSSKQNFPTVGKLLCTLTEDNQVLKDEMLMPHNALVFEKGSYLLQAQDALFNVLCCEAMQKLPEVLLESKVAKASMQLFDEDKKSAVALLTPIAQTYDIVFDVVEILDGWLVVTITSKRYGDISNFIGSSKQLLPKNIIAASNIAAYIIERLSKAQKRISFAESCTGGLLSYFFTRQNGASKIFDGSLVTYSNTLKENWLAVNEATLIEHGAVSGEVVDAMNEGVLSVSQADFAISISGIAGDDGGTEAKPVGTVFVGVKSRHYQKIRRLQLQGDRNYIQEQSVLYAVKMLLESDKELFF